MANSAVRLFRSGYLEHFRIGLVVCLPVEVARPCFLQTAGYTRHVRNSLTPTHECFNMLIVSQERRTLWKIAPYA